MQDNTIEYVGHTITIAQSECPIDPLEDRDCCIPTFVYHESLEEYGDPDIIGSIPVELTQRHARVKFLKEIGVPLKEFAHFHIDWDKDFYGALVDYLDSTLDVPRRRDWGTAVDYFDALERIVLAAGIPHFYRQSNGYRQGDSVLIFVVATRKWVHDHNLPYNELVNACKSVYKEYSSYLWGDVFQVTSIKDQEGNELVDLQVGDFYGDDWEENGLLEFVRESILQAKCETCAA